ncbi:MAG: HAD family phosphatase [Planctomycetia bacterium]|nr:HAD family phosphatase [Planctomycetia bacterium]
MTCSPERSPIRGVAFDLDGLLVNTEELYQHVGSELLRRRGRTFEPDLLDRMMGRPQQVSLQIMIDWHGLTDTIESLARETREIFAELLDTRLEPMPGAVPLVETLVRRGLPRGVATSSGPDFAHDVLSRVGLRDRFGFVLTSADVTHGKPHPEIYGRAAERLGVAPAEMLVFEDSENGCRAAVASGAVVVAVPGGHSRRHDFTGAHLVAESLADPRITRLLAIDRSE